MEQRVETLIAANLVILCHPNAEAKKMKSLTLLLLPISSLATLASTLSFKKRPEIR